MIPGSFKQESSDNKNEFTSFEMDISRTLTGVDISEKISFRNAQQNILHPVVDIAIILNSPSSELIHMTVVSWPNGWIENGNGKVKVRANQLNWMGQ